MAPSSLSRRDLLGLLAAGSLAGCGSHSSRDQETVVVYAALDREFSEPVLRDAGKALAI